MCQPHGNRFLDIHFMPINKGYYCILRGVLLRHWSGVRVPANPPLQIARSHVLKSKDTAPNSGNWLGLAAKYLQLSGYLKKATFWHCLCFYQFLVLDSAVWDDS
jgi:hypothetical protein